MDFGVCDRRVWQFETKLVRFLDLGLISSSMTFVVLLDVDDVIL